jgi:protein-tyrosine phosphatase
MPGPVGASRVMTARVLVVCTANVCRSRAAEELLREALAGADFPALVGSAGVRAVTGAPSCATMARLLGERGLWLDEAEGARRVTTELLQDQDLVLVPERVHRAALARLLPAARARTFTVLEAAALAEAVPERVGGPSRQRLQAQVAWMDRARGKVDLPVGEVRQGLRGLIRGGPEDPLDIPDVHAGSLRDHRRALERLQDGVARVVRGLAG